MELQQTPNLSPAAATTQQIAAATATTLKNEVYTFSAEAASTTTLKNKDNNS